MDMGRVGKLNLLGGLLLLGSLSACKPQLVQLMRSPDAPISDQPAGWVGSLHRHRQQLSVRDQRGQRQYVQLSAIWGYRTQNGGLHRLSAGDDYEVVQAGPVWVYQTQQWIGDAAWETDYFSLQPNGVVFLLDKRTCLAVFQSDSCMYSLVAHAKTWQLTSVDRQGSYGLNTLYRLCHHSIPPNHLSLFQTEAVTQDNRSTKK